MLCLLRDIHTAVNWALKLNVFPSSFNGSWSVGRWSCPASRKVIHVQNLFKNVLSFSNLNIISYQQIYLETVALFVASSVDDTAWHLHLLASLFCADFRDSQSVSVSQLDGVPKIK